jgi:hypothetical protein
MNFELQTSHNYYTHKINTDMENKLVKEVKFLRLVVTLFITLYGFQLLVSFKDKDDKVKFEEIDVERINIVEKDGTLKLALFNSAKLEKGVNQRAGQNEIAGMLFYNEEGHEAGGLVYRGKQRNGVQTASAGLMFDGYRQDQALALQYNEYKDSIKTEVNEGLMLNYRPDRSLVKEEYGFYRFIDTFSGSSEKKEELRVQMASQGKITTRRLFIGNKRGVKEGKTYDETGLDIRNKLGNTAIRLYVDQYNVPHLEMYDSTGKTKIYELDLKRKR